MRADRRAPDLPLRAYAVALRMASRATPSEYAAAITRSGFSPANSCAMPWSGCPTSASAGSRTSSRNSWNCLSGLMISIGIRCAVSPGASVGTTNSAGRSVPLPESASLPTTSTASAWSTPLIQTLRPDSTHSSPSRRGAVLISCEFEPASGSVIANAMVSDPSARPGSQRCFCSSVPNLPITVPQIAGETTIISSGQPAAPSSSSTIDSSTMPPPPPPYSSGRLTPRKPALPASAHSASVRPPAAGLLQEVGLPVPGAEVGDRRAQRPQLVALVEVQRHCSPSITASTRAGVHLMPPGRRPGSAPRRAAPATTGCCIFIASSTSSGWPALDGVAHRHVHRGRPCRASARRASPRRPAAATASGNRGSARSGHRPAVPVDVRCRRPRCAEVRRRCSTPATSSTTSSGVADTRTTSSRPSTSSPSRVSR